MSLADKAELLTPLMRLRRRRRATKLFGALLAVGILLLAGIVLAVNDGRNYRRLIVWLGVEDYLARPFATPPPQPLRSRRTMLILDTPTRLTDRRIGDEDRLETPFRLTAYERCERLGSDGGTPAVFHATGGEWECIFSREVGGVPQPSVLFIQIRGTSSNAFRTFRLKLNLLDPSQDSAIVQLTIEAIDRFKLELMPESRRYLDDRIKAGQGFTSFLEGYRITLERERGEDRRFNILVTKLLSGQKCGETGSPPRGTPMRSSIMPMAIDCLKLPQPRSSRTIQPD
jgi:hypothetical protein